MAATLLKKRLWHGCFPVNIAKFLRTSIWKNNCERLLLKQKIRKTVFFPRLLNQYMVMIGMLYKADPNPDTDLQKKWTLYKNLWYEIFATNLAFRKIQGLLFQVWQCLFQILAEKYPNKAICSKCNYFYF